MTTSVGQVSATQKQSVDLEGAVDGPTSSRVPVAVRVNHRSLAGDGDRGAWQCRTGIRRDNIYQLTAGDDHRQGGAVRLGRNAAGLGRQVRRPRLHADDEATDQ